MEIKIKNGEAPLSVDFSTGETFEPEGRLENGHLFFTVEIPPHLARGAIVKRNIPEK